MELSAHYQKITELSERMSILSEHLKLEEKKDRLEEVKLELENPDVWSDPDKAQSLGKERVQLDNLCETFSKSSSVKKSELLKKPALAFGAILNGFA